MEAAECVKDNCESCYTTMIYVMYSCYDEEYFEDDDDDWWVSLFGGAKDSATTDESSSGSFFFGFGVGASVMAAAWATYEVKCA